MNEPVLPDEQVTNAIGSSARLSSALADYPRVATCPTCKAYASGGADLADEWTVVAATLGHHDSGHQRDILLTASQHFGAYP